MSYFDKNSAGREAFHTAIEGKIIVSVSLFSFDQT